MRHTNTCPKCRQSIVLHIASVPDRRGDQNDIVADFKIAKVEVPKTSFLRPAYTAAFGEMSAVVCRTCGYTELYVKDPGSIPIDGEHVREVVGPAGR